MAGFIANDANWDALLQEDYVAKQIVDAINTATPFKDELKRTGPTSGRERVYVVKVGASQGTGARREGANMPNYGAGEYQNAKVHAAYNYAPFKLTGQAEVFTSGKAFVEAGLQILQDTKEGLRLSIGRQCWGDGQGILANVDGAFAAGATTITASDAYGVLWGSLTTLTTFLIKRNMYVQFGTEDNSGLGYKVTSVGTTTFVITPPLANNVADEANITILGSAGIEITGAMVFAATAAFMTTLGVSTLYHGIDRTLFPEWEGNVVNANAALSLALIRSTRDAIYKRTDDEESNLMIGSTEMARDYEALLVAAQRFTPPEKLRGGHTMLSHDGLDFSKDSRAPIKALFFFDTNYIAWMEAGGGPNWLKDGNGLMRVVPGQDAKEALLRYYAEVDVEQPRRQAILFNVVTS